MFFLQKNQMTFMISLQKIIIGSCLTNWEVIQLYKCYFICYPVQISAQIMGIKS